MKHKKRDNHSSLLTELKTLNAKQESLKLAQEVGSFGSWEIDLITKKSTWSEQSYHIYRLNPETTSPTLETFTSRVIDEDKPKLAKGMASLSDGKIKSIRLRIRRGDNVIITVLINGKYIFDENKKPIKLIGTTLDITKEIKLKQENEELASILENFSHEIYIIDKESYLYLYANKKAFEALQYTAEELYAMSVLEINKTMIKKELLLMKEELIEKKFIFNRTIHTRRDGTTYPVQSYIQLREYKGREVAIVFDIDISNLLEIEEKHKKQSQILEQIEDSVISTDLEGIITHWNNGATSIYGYSSQEMIGQSIALIHPKKEREDTLWIQEEVLLKGIFQGEVRKIRKDRKIIYTHTTASLLKNDYGKVIGITRYSQDRSHQKQIEKNLEKQRKLLNFQAYHDTLTKLPNRAFFNKKLQKIITKSSKKGQKFALFFIDLDNFKQVNDTLGHHYGDELLKVVAQRFATCVKKKDILSRVGGDEFTLLLKNLPDYNTLEEIATRLIDILRPKIIIEGVELHIGASIGISLYPQDALFKNDLLKYADIAMYTAKNKGRNGYQFYTKDMTHYAMKKAMMETSLHKGIEGNAFLVYYQPQIDLRDNSIVGVEALVRWNHPEEGLIFPNKFIELAEELNFIQKLDTYVMYQAMKDIQSLYDKGIYRGSLSLNLSIKQLMSINFIETLKSMIKKTNFNIKRLEFEITESQVMRDPQKSIEILQTLSDMGIKIAIDDFGTGYSSLAYLKRLPVDKLKIDRSFIQDIPFDEEDVAITKAVIALAKSLKLSLIAEGVETKKQIECLEKESCFIIQGFYYSKAIEIEALTEYISKNIKK